MNPFETDAPKVKVAQRTDTMSGHAPLLAGLLLLVLVNVIVLIGRTAGGM